jgi:thiamine biosynthesis lipoprotein
MKVLTESKTVFQASGGTFDPTVGPLVDLWGFGPDFHQDRVPEKVEIERLLGVIGFDGITLQDTRATRIRDVRVDLSAIAKGFAVDQVAELLQGYDLVNFMVEVGGEIRVSGHNSANTPWQLAIEKPSVAERAIQRIVGVTDLAIATSGSYRNFFELNGVRYSHTIDPRTGYPVTHNMVSVTVLADTCAQADALATAFTVMGPERTLELADQLNIAVFLLVEDITGIKEFYSTGFQPYMKDQ